MNLRYLEIWIELYLICNRGFVKATCSRIVYKKWTAEQLLNKHDKWWQQICIISVKNSDFL